METDLIDMHGFVVWSDFPGSPLRSPASSRQEPPEFLIPSIHPPRGPDEAVGTQRVGTGVEQPGSMALVLCRGIDDERLDRALLTWVGILVLTRHSGREADHPLSVRCDENPKSCPWRSFDGSAPGLHHLGQRNRGEH